MSDEPLGDVATRLLFENDRVKVWEMVLAPGERSDRHRHDLAYLLCIVEGSTVDAEMEGRGLVSLPVSPGTVYFVPPGATETAVNNSDTTFREFLIELKDPPEGGFGPARHGRYRPGPGSSEGAGGA